MTDSARSHAPTLGEHAGPVSRPVDAPMFRRLMGRFATGVTVVTTAASPHPLGMTVNSFASVSLDPPLVLLCLRNGSSTGEWIERAAAFAVNILSRDQEEVARVFAGAAGDRFSHVRTVLGATGSPIIVGSLAYVDCRVMEVHRGGDHRIVLGRVVDGGVLTDADPLLFYRGSYL